MGKGFLSSAKSFAKNVALHTRGLVKGEESVRDALTGVGRDSKKLTRTLHGSVKKEDEKTLHTNALVKKGRERYNAKDYGAAEKCFREALMEDPHQIWAMLYLGHTFYQQGRAAEAIVSWRRAHAEDPVSEAGLKAQRKIQHVEKATSDTVKELQERLRE